MMRLFALTALPLVFAGCVETTASGGTGAAVLPMAEKAALFDSAVASIGCELRFESDYLPVELQTGLSRADIQAVAARQVRRGFAVALADGGVRSTVGGCADGAVPAAAAPAA